MNMEYRVLWIDDDDGYVEATEELLEDRVRENYMNMITKIYYSWEEYNGGELANFDSNSFNQYDLILVDYNLSGISVTGAEIIRDIRSRNIFTDIIFYSSDYNKLKEEIMSSDHIDGIFCADREVLEETVSKVIKKNLKREYNIANIRGLVMDSTSEFDYICRTTVTNLFSRLPDEKKTIIIDKLKSYISEVKEESERKFEEIINCMDNSKLIKEVMESVDYVMKNEDRYNIMALVMREFEGENSIYDDNFASNYKAALITPRNNMAHKKIKYCKSYKKALAIKKRKDFDCNENCETCSKRYGIKHCDEIRERIFKYYQIFSDTEKKVDNILKEQEKILV